MREAGRGTRKMRNINLSSYKRDISEVGFVSAHRGGGVGGGFAPPSDVPVFRKSILPLLLF